MPVYDLFRLASDAKSKRKRGILDRFTDDAVTTKGLTRERR